MLCPHGAGLNLAHRESGRKSPEERRAMTNSAVLSSHRTQESLASLLRKVSFVEVQHDLEPRSVQLSSEPTLEMTVSVEVQHSPV